jgi:hypothetical protein
MRALARALRYRVAGRAGAQLTPWPTMPAAHSARWRAATPSTSIGMGPPYCSGAAQDCTSEA